MKHIFYKNQDGMITPLILIIASIFIIFGVSLISWAITNHKDTIRKVRKIQSLQVAEAGVSYYKWHLAHDSSDYKDGNGWCCNNNPALTLTDCGGVCGPYVHQYEDYNDDVIGEFSLLITPPEIGSTVNTVESTGYAYGNDSIQKKVTALVGKRSLAEYSFLTNAPLWLGENEGFAGPIHSNGGIRFDTVATAEVTSAVNNYNCSGALHGCSGVKPGIWGTGGPTTLWRPLSEPIITSPAGGSVFNIIVPSVPAIDYSLFTVSLADIKADAITNGIYFGDNSGICGDGVCGRNGTVNENHGSCPADCPAGCGNHNCNAGETNITCPRDCFLEGFLVKFKADATVDIYSVNTLMAQVGYYNVEQGGCRQEAEQIQNKTLLGNFAMPNNGLIFIENDVWVEGTVNGRATVGAAIFPVDTSNYARIRINDNIQYLARDGNNVFGLMAQGDVLVPKYAPTNLTIDAMLFSQMGHVYYRGYVYCGSGSVKNSIEVYGGTITNLFWTWTWVSWNGSSWVTVDGYNTTNTIYNNYLTFAPPPSFPTSENYEVLSWEEE